MADIELVVKINEKDYDDILNGETKASALNYSIFNAIRTGTTLPKGHGRLGDLDKLIRIMKDRDEDNGGEPLNAVDRGYHLAYEHLCEEIDNLLKENEDGNDD